MASLGERDALKQQITDLRHQYEILAVVDPEKIHIMRQETGISRLERFQVYLPEGRDYRLKYDMQDFPRGTNSSASNTGIIIPPGRYDVMYMLQNDSGSTPGSWEVHISVIRPGYLGRVDHGLPNGGPNWLTNSVQVDAYRYRLESEEVAEHQRTIHFSDATSPDKGKVVLHDVMEEATLYRYEVRNPVEMIGTLQHHARWEQEVFRIWIEAEPKP